MTKSKSSISSRGNCRSFFKEWLHGSGLTGQPATPCHKDGKTEKTDKEPTAG